MIKINQPLSFTEQGMKDNQEDYLFPQHATRATRTFILCDGMGGHDNGEVASRTAATAIGTALTDMQANGATIGELEFARALAKGYDALDAIDTGSPKKPGTTLTCLCLNENSFLAAHIGDSRIYQIRPKAYNPDTRMGGILYQSSDHSLVNDLLKAGELTEQEARDFPQRNVITRAMQPHLDHRYKAELYTFNDVEAGDYFFLCCDGVLEHLNDTFLCSILSQNISDEDKLKAIKAICDQGTRDNYTCWLIPVAEAKILGRRPGPLDSEPGRSHNVAPFTADAAAIQAGAATPPMMAGAAMPATGNAAAGGTTANTAKPRKEGFLQNKLNLVILSIGVVLIALLCWLGWSWYSTDNSGLNPKDYEEDTTPGLIDSRERKGADANEDAMQNPNMPSSEEINNLPREAKRPAKKPSGNVAKPGGSTQMTDGSATSKDGIQGEPSSPGEGQPAAKPKTTEQGNGSTTTTQGGKQNNPKNQEYY